MIEKYEWLARLTRAFDDCKIILWKNINRQGGTRGMPATVWGST